MYDIEEHIILSNVISRPPKLKFELACSFATHNICPYGVIDGEDWSETRNEITTVLSYRGAVFKA